MFDKFLNLFCKVGKLIIREFVCEVVLDRD